MSQLDKLKDCQAAFFKKIAWRGQGVDLRRFYETEAGLFRALADEIALLPDIQLLNVEITGKSIDFHLLFHTVKAHAVFNEAFYIQGSLKDAFKNCMRKAKEQQLAFYMATSSRLAWTRLLENSALQQVHRNCFYEIKKNAMQKFFAQLPENHESFGFFQWILSQPQTLSVTAFYDTGSNSRYLQSLFYNYDQTFENRIIEHRRNFPNYSVKRHEHNREQGLVYHSSGENTELDISLFPCREPEYFRYVDPANTAFFPLSLF